MSPTAWTEVSAPANGWTEGKPENDGTDDFFIDFLFEGTGFFNNVVSWTERTAAAVSYTEKTAPAVTWTEKLA